MNAAWIILVCLGTAWGGEETFWELSTEFKADKTSTKTKFRISYDGEVEFEGRRVHLLKQAHAGVMLIKLYVSWENDGLVMRGSETEYLGAGADYPASVSVNDPPALMWPADLSVGRRWSTNSSGKIISGHAKGTKVETTGSCEALKEEEVRVPAGKFKAFVMVCKEKSETASGNVESTSQRWFAPEVGYWLRLDTDQTVLTSHHDIKQVLVDYHLGEDGKKFLSGFKATVPKPTVPPLLTASVGFFEPSGDRFLDAKESGKLVVTISNKGPGPAYAVRLVPALPKPIAGLGVLLPVEAGTIEPGKTVSLDIPLEAAGEIGSGAVTVKLEIKEGNGFDADPKVIEFETRGFKAPKLEIAALKLGGTGVVKAGEPAALTLTVRNAGEGPARGVAALFDLGSPDIFAASESSLVLGVLRPGESKAVHFDFLVNKRYKAGKALPLSVSLTEAEGRYGVEPRPLGLALGESAPSPEVVSFKGRAEPKMSHPVAPESEDVDAPPKTQAPYDPESFAVVIGIERYRDVPAVDFAAKDAQAVHGYLTRAMGFDPKNVILLQNERASGKDFDKYLGTWLKNRVTDKSRVFIYYAGHGAPNPSTGEGYLLPYEGDPAYTEDTAYPLKRLYDNLARLPARDVTVALDACFSGSGGRSVMAKWARPLVTTANILPPAGRNTVVLSATSADQISASSPEREHGLLTYHLLKGLRGGADSDQDGAVTTAELFGYVRPVVEREARLQNVDQSPTLTPALDSLQPDKAARVWIKIR